MRYPASSRYREMEVLAMPPARRLVMLFSHLLVCLKQARRHLERGEIELRGERLLLAEEIVRELIMSLDHEAGGALAASLDSIYRWLLGEFVGVHAKPDIARLDAAIVVVTDLHEAWEGAAAQVAGVPAA